MPFPPGEDGVFLTGGVDAEMQRESVKWTGGDGHLGLSVERRFSILWRKAECGWNASEERELLQECLWLCICLFVFVSCLLV